MVHTLGWSLTSKVWILMTPSASFPMRKASLCYSTWRHCLGVQVRIGIEAVLNIYYIHVYVYIHCNAFYHVYTVKVFLLSVDVNVSAYSFRNWILKDLRKEMTTYMYLRIINQHALIYYHSFYPMHILNGIPTQCNDLRPRKNWLV